MKNIKSEELAEIVGVSNTYMRQIESENSNYHCSFETLYKISVALDVTLDDLIQK